MNGDRPAVVMAIVPNARGFGYAVFEGALPVDWGVSDVAGADRNKTYMRRITALVGKYEPDVLLLRHPTETRSPRVADLIRATATVARASGALCVPVPRAQVREAFGYLPRPTRVAIAHAIAERIAFFEPLLPPVRKIWNSEDRRMGLFDAVALALAYLDGSGGREAAA